MSRFSAFPPPPQEKNTQKPCGPSGKHPETTAEEACVRIIPRISIDDLLEAFDVYAHGAGWDICHDSGREALMLNFGDEYGEDLCRRINALLWLLRQRVFSRFKIDRHDGTGLIHRSILGAAASIPLSSATSPRLIDAMKAVRNFKSGASA